MPTQAHPDAAGRAAPRPAVADRGYLPLAAAVVLAAIVGLVAPGQGYLLNILMQTATA